MTDFLFDWTGARLDGANTVTSGDRTVTLALSTPPNCDGNEATLLSLPQWGGDALAVQGGRGTGPRDAHLFFARVES